MSNRFIRTELLLGKESMEILADSRVAVFGIGGVGSYAAEALVRSGVGTVDLIDDDIVCDSNINRQLFATGETVGRQKTEAAAERLREINPEAVINTYPVFYSPQTAAQFDLSQYDYIIDAIDTVTAKLALAETAYRCGTPIISSMGAGNKLDPTAFRVTDIYKTSVCPLAKVMRTELKKRGIKKLKVVYSRELPLKPAEINEPQETARRGASRRQTPGSVAFVPPVAGLIAAGEVIKDLTGIRGRGMGV